MTTISSAGEAALESRAGCYHYRLFRQNSIVAGVCAKTASHGILSAKEGARCFAWMWNAPRPSSGIAARSAVRNRVRATVWSC